MKTLIFTLLIAAATSVQANDLPKVLLYGNVIGSEVKDLLEPKSADNSTMVSDVKITIRNGDDEIIKEYMNRPTGFYSVILDGGHDYTVTFSKSGYIQKKVEIKAHDLEPLEKQKSFKLLTDITLFAQPENGDFTPFARQPMARCTYNASRQRLEWDMQYARIAFNKFVERARNTQQHTASTN
jgi:hypothetical protein